MGRKWDFISPVITYILLGFPETVKGELELAHWEWPATLHVKRLLLTTLWKRADGDARQARGLPQCSRKVTRMEPLLRQRSLLEMELRSRRGPWESGSREMNRGAQG